MRLELETVLGEISRAQKTNITGFFSCKNLDLNNKWHRNRKALIVVRKEATGERMLGKHQYCVSCLVDGI